jgi:hypothetical protein
MQCLDSSLVPLVFLLGSGLEGTWVAMCFTARCVSLCLSPLSVIGKGRGLVTQLHAGMACSSGRKSSNKG